MKPVHLARIAATILILGTAACGSHKTTVVTSDGGTVTTSDDNKTATVKTDQGTATYGQGAVAPSTLGLPIYPGAQAKGNGAASIQTAAGSSQMINLQTADSFDKVYAFYKQQMPANSEKMKMSAGGTSMAEFQVGDTDADRKSVAITQKGSDPTSILITHETTTGQASPAATDAGPSAPPSPDAMGT